MKTYDTWKTTEHFDTEQEDQEETEDPKLHIEWSLTYNLYFIVDAYRYDVSEGFESYLEAQAVMDRMLSDR